jgi:HSP20 family protein
MTNLIRRDRDVFDSPFRALQREMDSLFRAFSDEAGVANLTPYSFQFPVAEFTETPENFLLKAEVPGLNAKDVQIEISGDVLTMTGEKKEETRHEKANVHFTERRFGKWQRSFRLPAAADGARVEARMTNGVLEVTIGKKAEAKPQVIAVKAN